MKILKNFNLGKTLNYFINFQFLPEIRNSFIHNELTICKKATCTLKACIMGV